MKDCFLIVPWMQDSWKKKEYQNREFLGVQYLAAMLSLQKIDYQYINAHAERLNSEEIVEQILREGTGFVAITSHSQRGYPSVVDLVKKLRHSGYHGHICLGGFYASIEFKRILSHLTEIDTILIGEGEYTLPQLVKNYKDKEKYQSIEGLAYRTQNGICFTDAKKIRDLDALPFPVRNPAYAESEKLGRQFQIIAGRGCYGTCSFCTKGKHFVNSYKVYRSPANIADELYDIITTYGVHNFSFVDEIFYDCSPKAVQWVMDFVDEIKRRALTICFEITMRVNDIREDLIAQLKSIGLYRVSVGIESAVPRVLKEMNKKITVEQSKAALETIARCGVEPKFTFITIVPTMTFEELKQNYRFLFEVDINTLSEGNLYNRLNVFSGCAYETILMERGLLIPQDCFYARHNYLYADPRVEVFVTIIKQIRKLFSSIKEEIYLKKDDTEEYRTFFSHMKLESKKVWVKIIRELLIQIECGTKEELLLSPSILVMVKAYKNHCEQWT